MGLDIGSESVELFQSALKDCKTVIWNGPMGVFEFEKFATGTNEIFSAISKSKGMTVVGGGETAMAFITNDATAMTAVAASSVAMPIVTASATAMSLIAESNNALATIFADKTNRTIIWDSGKNNADLLMRNSANASAWIAANVATTKVSNLSNSSALFTPFSGKAYYLGIGSNGDSNGNYYYSGGTFVGDYNTGNGVQLTTGISPTPTLINERSNGVNGYCTGSTNDSDWSPKITYIEME